MPVPCCDAGELTSCCVHESVIRYIHTHTFVTTHPNPQPYSLGAPSWPGRNSASLLVWAGRSTSALQEEKKNTDEHELGDSTSTPTPLQPPYRSTSGIIIIFSSFLLFFWARLHGSVLAFHPLPPLSLLCSGFCFLLCVPVSRPFFPSALLCPLRPGCA